MELALELAEKCVGQAHPNPHVGAVVASGASVFGTGQHIFENIHHAERLALIEAGENAIVLFQEAW